MLPAQTLVEIKTTLETFLAFLEGRFTWSLGQDLRTSMNCGIAPVVARMEFRLHAALAFATQDGIPLWQAGAQIPDPDRKDPCWSDETSFAEKPVVFVLAELIITGFGCDGAEILGVYQTRAEAEKAEGENLSGRRWITEHEVQPRERT